MDRMKVNERRGLERREMRGVESGVHRGREEMADDAFQSKLT